MEIIIFGWLSTTFLDAGTAFDVLNVFAFSDLGWKALSIGWPTPSTCENAIDEASSTSSP